MIAQNYGRIVNVASIAGKEGNPNACAYSASKAGVIALTKSLGKELAGHDIAVNCVTPAAAKTAIFDQMTQAAHRLHARRRSRAAGSSWSTRSPTSSPSAPRRNAPSPPAPCSTFPAAARRIESSAGTADLRSQLCDAPPLRHSGAAPKAEPRNPDAYAPRWISGSRCARPGMTKMRTARRVRKRQPRWLQRAPAVRAAPPRGRSCRRRSAAAAGTIAMWRGCE